MFIVDWGPKFKKKMKVPNLKKKLKVIAVFVSYPYPTLLCLVRIKL